MYRSFHVSVMWWASLDEGIYLPTCQSNPSSSCIPFSREKEIMQRAPLLKPLSGQRESSCDAYSVDMIRGEGLKGMWILFCFPCMLPSLSLTDSPTMFVKYLDRVHKIEISREKKKSGQHHLNDKVTTWERGLWWLFASSPLSVVWFSWP